MGRSGFFQCPGPDITADPHRKRCGMCRSVVDLRVFDNGGILCQVCIDRGYRPVVSPTSRVEYDGPSGTVSGPYI